MTNRTDVQAAINLLTAKEGVPDSVSPTNLAADQLQVMADKGAMVDEVLSPVALAETLFGGWANYQDLATQTVLFNVVGGSPPVKIPNDGLGAFTFENKLPASVTSLYNITTQQIDLSDLKVGDMFSIRFDLEVTTNSNSQDVAVSAVFAIGSPSEFIAVIAQGTKKLAGAIGFFREVSFAAFNDDFKDFPAELRIESDDDCTVKVNGYFLKSVLIGQ